jgi:hypothetical protein
VAGVEGVVWDWVGCGGVEAFIAGPFSPVAARTEACWPWPAALSSTLIFVARAAVGLSAGPATAGAVSTVPPSFVAVRLSAGPATAEAASMAGGRAVEGTSVERPKVEDSLEGPAVPTATR